MTIESIITNIFLIQALGILESLTWNFPSWSISVEFYTYVLYAFLLCLFGKNKSAAAVFFCALIITSLLIIFVLSDNSQDGSYNLGFYRCLSGFFCGVIVYLFHKKHTVMFGSFATFAEISVVVMALFFVCGAGGAHYSIIAPFLFGLVVFVYAREEGVVSKIMCLSVFQKWGEWSYSIYMIHAFVMINIINRPISIIEKKFDTSLTTDIKNITSIDLGPDVKRMIVLGGQYQADILAVLYVIVVVMIASQTYRFIEVPCRSYFNTLAARIRHPSR